MSGPRDASSHTVRVGEELVIRLAENPTTGYVWQIRQSGAGALRVAESRFESGTPAGARAPAGAGGERVVRLVGERPGRVQVEALRRRPWEPDSAALERKEFRVEVTEEGRG